MIQILFCLAATTVCGTWLIMHKPKKVLKVSIAIDITGAINGMHKLRDAFAGMAESMKICREHLETLNQKSEI